MLAVRSRNLGEHTSAARGMWTVNDATRSTTVPRIHRKARLHGLANPVGVVWFHPSWNPAPIPNIRCVIHLTTAIMHLLVYVHQEQEATEWPAQRK